MLVQHIISWDPWVVKAEPLLDWGGVDRDNLREVNVQLVASQVHLIRAQHQQTHGNQFLPLFQFVHKS